MVTRLVQEKALKFCAVLHDFGRDDVRLIILGKGIQRFGNGTLP